MNAQSPSAVAARTLRGGILAHIPPPATPVATSVRLELRAAADAAPEAVFTDPQREQGWRVVLQPVTDGLWATEIMLPQEPTLLRYHFILADGSIIREHRQKEGVVEPLFGVWGEEDFRIAVYTTQSGPPAWVAGQIVYQIVPDRFAQADPHSLTKGDATNYGRDSIRLAWADLPERPPKGRDFYGGDLRGVIGKLDYLHDLGVSCIYFTPIFASPSNHRYDAIDYMQIDPRLGTEDDLRELIAAAAERGMRVLLDGVFNHCSNASIYFRAAQADKQSPYYRWFNFQHWPDGYAGWADVKAMPEFVECPEVEDFFFGPQGIAQHWLGYGTAGWRTDVTPWLTDVFWRRFRRAVRHAYPDAYIVAEDWGDVSHRLLGDTYDATMNYRFGYSVVGFAGGKLTPAELDDRLETLRRDTPPAQFAAQLNVIGSHDTARLVTRLEGDKNRVMLAAALQLAYPGVPMIYYGDETGIEGDYAEDSRRAFPWAAIDPQLHAFYQRAMTARRNSAALGRGTVETVWLDERGGYGFVRRSESDSVCALFNIGQTALDAAVVLPADLPDGNWADMLGSLPDAIVSGGSLQTRLPAKSAAWFRAPHVSE